MSLNFNFLCVTQLKLLEFQNIFVTNIKTNSMIIDLPVIHLW